MPNEHEPYVANPWFPVFRSNPAIQTIAGLSKWTASDKDKRPIDMVDFMTRGKIHGAIYQDAKSLVTLDTLNQACPWVNNYTFYLDAIFDKIVVLDIEPTCPMDVRNELLCMEPLYMETSMSGKGLHMIFPYPEHIMDKYPNAQTKKVLKGPNHDYEILLEHFVTFTGRVLEQHTPAQPKSFETLFEQLAAQQEETALASDIEIDDVKEPTAKSVDNVFFYLRNAEAAWNNTPNDYKKEHGTGNDISLYEYSYIGYLLNRLQSVLHVQTILKDHIYTPEEQVWILHEMAKEYLPYRAKHDSYRNGEPWLIYLIKTAMSKNDTYQKFLENYLEGES